MTLNKLTNASQEAMGDYDAAQAAIGNASRRSPSLWWQRRFSPPAWRGPIKDWSGSGRAIQRDWTTPRGKAERDLLTVR
jgi:hypothetical protein